MKEPKITFGDLQKIADKAKAEERERVLEIVKDALSRADQLHEHTGKGCWSIVHEFIRKYIKTRIQDSEGS